MRVETFFEKFELLADTPDALPRLRELVLELAVRGRFTNRDEQDQADPTWDAFAERTSVIEASLNAKGAAPFVIPAAWRWTTLDALGDVKPRNAAGDGDSVAFVPMTLVLAEYGRRPQHSVRLWGEVKKGYTHLKDGDLVLAKITPCFENGKSAVMIGLTGGMGAGTTELHVCRITKAPALPEFVLIYLKSRGFIERGIPRMTGSAGQKRVPHDYFARSPIPLPPPAEQKRIVAKVDELMALCDRLEAQQQERKTRHAALARASLARFADAPTLANLDFLFHDAYTVEPADLRKIILAVAVSGKLVCKELGDDEAKTTFPELARAAVFGDDNRFPAHWLRVPLGKAGEWRGGGTPSKARADYWVGEIPWVSPKDMKVLHIGDAQDHISPAAVEGSSVRIIPPSSLLMVVRGMILARAFPVALTVREVTINQDMKALLPAEPATSDFLLVALRAIETEVLALIERSTHGTCKLETDQLHDIVIPIPPLAEQHRIVAKVDQLMILVDRLEARLAAARTTSAALLEAAIHDLLNPTAEIIPFSSIERSSLPDRAAIGCYAIQRLGDKRTFGRTAEVKVLYLADAHLGLDLGGRYLRDAAGPLDQWIYKFEEEAARQQWFSVVESATKDGHKKIDYRKGPSLSAKAQEAATRLSVAQRLEFDRLLNLLAQRPTVEVEIIATLFAAWNDFLIDGRAPSDDEIVQEVRENWHPSKLRFAQAELKTWLAWLRQHALVPQGKGPHTVGQQGKLQLH
jgi:type I restriction enzyme, S subunit